MKSLRYLMFAVAIVIILTTGSWLLRNSIIQRISNPILADYDVELVDVSLDALATNAASISYLELLHAKDTTIKIENLMLPITTTDISTKAYSAQRVTIVTTTRDDDAPLEPAQLIDQFLSLSDSLAGTSISIAELNLPSYPSIRDLGWAISDSEQHLSWTIKSVNMSVETTRTSRTTYDVRFSLPKQANADGMTNAISGKLQQQEQAISIAGHSTLELPAWQAIAKLAGILPDAVDLRSGHGELQYEVEIPFDVSQPPTVIAIVDPSSPWKIDYADKSGDSTAVLLSSGSAINLRATFPEVDWSLQQADVSLLVTNNEWNNLPLSIGDLSCQLGPTCSMNADIVWPDADTPMGSAANIAVSSVLDVTFPIAGVRVDIHPEASFELSGLSTPDNSAKRVDARLMSSATMQFADDGWRFSADSIDAAIESFSLDTDIAISSLLYFENIEASERESTTSTSTGIFSPSIELALNNQSVTLPGIKGGITQQGAIIAFDLATIDLLKNGSISGQHNLDSGIGGVVIANVELTFDDAPLSSRITPWESDFDIGAGNIAVDLQAKWAPSTAGSALESQSTIRMDALAGFYADIAFTGASADIELDYGAGGISLAPTAVRVGLVDIGVPIENISADIKVDVDELAVDVDNLRLTAFNGAISAAPFSFHTARDVNNVILTAREIELAELLSIKEFAAVNVTGTIAAVLPITFAEDGISIKAGRLTGEEPGGVIRYLGSDGLDSGDMSGLGLATAALSNFEYESLTADVNYSMAGDLQLQMQIKGRNPELDDGRPVILNLGVENNVPQMLKSLQAARAVEEILEKRLAD